MAQTLLLWLVTYVGLFAIVGFLLTVGRGFSDRPWSNRAIVRASSGLAFGLSVLIWLVLLLTG